MTWYRQLKYGTISKKAQKSLISISYLSMPACVKTTAAEFDLSKTHLFRSQEIDPINTEIIEGAGHVPKVGKFRKLE